MSRTRRIRAIILTCFTAWGLTALSVYVLRDYSFALFVLLPLICGVMPTLIHGADGQATKRQTMGTTFLSLLFCFLGMVFLAIEGLVCIFMATPLTIFLAWIGHLIGWQILKKRREGLPTGILIFAVLSVPAIMGFEHAIDSEPTPHPVITSIEINAGPEEVWKNVVVFPELSEPTELLFKAGIAYPINARIDGNGVGAVRYCNFSTGAFVEPITVWNKPDLLAFDVAEQPETMKEMSPYDLHPNHLHGYLVSKKGQFKLTRLSNGHTLLEGTTWYYNKMRPALYWNLWGDHIIHTIHNRVLSHIKSVSEKHG